MLTKANEALFAEMLLEAEQLIGQLQVMQETWPNIIEKGTQDGIKSAMLNTKMSFEQLMKEEAGQLKQKAIEAAKIIQAAQNCAFASFLKTHKAINSRGKSFIVICAGMSFFAALVGCFIGVKLAFLV